MCDQNDQVQSTGLAPVDCGDKDDDMVLDTVNVHGSDETCIVRGIVRCGVCLERGKRRL